MNHVDLVYIPRRIWKSNSVQQWKDAKSERQVESGTGYSYIHRRLPFLLQQQHNSNRGKKAESTATRTAKTTMLRIKREKTMRSKLQPAGREGKGQQ